MSEIEHTSGAVSASAAIEQARHLLVLIERQVAFMLAQSRQAVETFFAVNGTGGQMLLRNIDLEQVAGIVPRGRDLDRFAARWATLVPDDPAVRATLGSEIGHQSGLAYEQATGIRAALRLDSAEIRETHERLFGTLPAAAYVARVDEPADGVAETFVDAVEADLEWLSLPGGAVLFRQGDPGDALYLVVNGRLRVMIETPDGETRVLNELGRGEMLGEMAVITGQPRSATIEASRDTELVRLSKASFERLVDRHPRGVMQIAQMLVLRLQRQTSGVRRPTSTVTSVAIVPGGSGAPLGMLADGLVAALARWGPTLHLDAARLDAALGDGTAQTPPEGLDHSRLLAWLSQREGHYRYVVYQADHEPSAWSERCVRQADRVLVAADADGSLAPHPVEAQVGRIVETMAAAPRQELVLLHRRRDRMPSGTTAWLSTRPTVATHHHLCLDTPDDFRRLARRLTGRAIGLALSGGGSRGNVYIGVMRAIHELGIPIDVVGGTSVGSLLGAQVGLEWNSRTMRDETRRRTVDHPPKKHITLPIVSLSTGRGYVDALRDLFGDLQIEDMWIRYFAVCSDLTIGDVRIHQRGPVTRAIRASLSVPGLFPPVAEGGHLLIDGGPLNNLPADITQQMCEGGKVIAVNCNPRRGLEAPWDYGETLRVRDLLWHRFRPSGKHRPIPTIASILERTTMITSVRQAADVSRASADLYLHPPTDDLSMFDSSSFDQAVDIGYDYAFNLLADWKESAFGPNEL